MLTDLVQTIETLQERIRAHGSFIGDYESRTRVTLIDPMLCALGWDVSDPRLVHIEPRTANGWADYALMDRNTPVIFVEAKKLAERDVPIQQTVGYAVSENIQHRSNVRYCASTNGDRWEVYDIRAQESVMSVSLSREDAPKCALKLLGLWRDSLLSNGLLDLPVALGEDDESGDDETEDDEIIYASVEEVQQSRISVIDNEDTFTDRDEWGRGQYAEKLLVEVLLTREEWSNGQSLVEELQRTAADRGYSLRRFQPGWVAWKLSEYRYSEWVEF